MIPPTMKMITRIYHPNIDERGRVCMDLLKRDKWKANYCIQNILMATRELLREPNAHDPLDADIAK